MRGVPTEGGSEAYLVRTSQRRASAPGTHPEDGCRRWAFFSSLLDEQVDGQNAEAEESEDGSTHDLHALAESCAESGP
jgi:hypothetical protein